MKEKLKYAIFEVHDYKGGELSSDINLPFHSFISNLTDQFTDYNNTGKKQSLEFYIKHIKAKLKDKSNFYSTYACGDGFCGELYKIEDTKLIKVKFDDYIEDIAKLLMECDEDEDDDQ